MDSEVRDRRRAGPAAALARMPTGAKVFLILVGALLPLALIALFTMLQTNRDAARDARARLHAATTESSQQLGKALAVHLPQLRAAALALERDPRDAASCAHVLSGFAALAQGGLRISVIGQRGDVVCGQRLIVAGASVVRPGQLETLVTPDGLVLRVGGDTGGAATAFYPASTLATLARPGGFVPEYGAAVIKDGDRLVLRTLAGGGTLSGHEDARSKLGVDGLELEMTMPGAPIAGPLTIATVLLVLMWLAAAAIGWFVVDRLLIRPLRRLRAEVSGYTPGELLDPAWSGSMPAQEIRDLGNTFRDIARTVQAHEAGLAEGLVRQTRLTREVHHRVKNNLQVIASLINFHARGAKSPEASEAYTSIQRRVDALAVVHRHHYAELEENRGLELRSVIGELASNLRATAAGTSAVPVITLEIEPFLVNQDVAIAIAFLLTELIELAMGCADGAQIRISVKQSAEPDRAVLRVNSPALVESATLEMLIENRYGRVIQGLARQLRTKLHHDPLVGAYEATIAITGRP